MFEVEAELALLKTNFFHTFVTQIKKMANRINFILLIFLILSCDSKPKVIVADANSRDTGAPTNTEVAKVESESIADDLHQVVAQEILNTDKYTYVNVTEKSDKFWIAVSKQKIEKGHTYYFRGGKKIFTARSLIEPLMWFTWYQVLLIQKLIQVVKLLPKQLLLHPCLNQNLLIQAKLKVRAKKSQSKKYWLMVQPIKVKKYKFRVNV